MTRKKGKRKDERRAAAGAMPAHAAERMRTAGQFAAELLDLVAEAIRPGMTTAGIDRMGDDGFMIVRAAVAVLW